MSLVRAQRATGAAILCFTAPTLISCLHKLIPACSCTAPAAKAGLPRAIVLLCCCVTAPAALPLYCHALTGTQQYMLCTHMHLPAVHHCTAGPAMLIPYLGLSVLPCNKLLSCQHPCRAGSTVMWLYNYKNCTDDVSTSFEFNLTMINATSMAPAANLATAGMTFTGAADVSSFSDLYA